MDETGAQFEIYEFGVAAFLFKDRNEEMIKILKTCQSIEVFNILIYFNIYIFHLYSLL